MSHRPMFLNQFRNRIFSLAVAVSFFSSSPLAFGMSADETMTGQGLGPMTGFDSVSADDGMIPI